MTKLIKGYVILGEVNFVRVFLTGEMLDLNFYHYIISVSVELLNIFNY